MLTGRAHGLRKLLRGTMFDIRWWLIEGDPSLETVRCPGVQVVAATDDGEDSLRRFAFVCDDGRRYAGVSRVVDLDIAIGERCLADIWIIRRRSRLTRRAIETSSVLWDLVRLETSPGTARSK